MSLKEDSKLAVDAYRGDYPVVCFDCQTPHEMAFPEGMQAEAFAAVMTRYAKTCPVCGGTTWIALGDVGDALDGTRVHVLETLMP